jgi:hypothetical protein
MGKDWVKLPSGLWMRDPTYQVAEGLDDVYELESNGAVTDHATFDACFSSTLNTGRFWGGCRWVVSITKGSTILTCVWTPYVYDITVDDANFNIYFEYLGAPVQFATTAHNVTGRTRTSHSVPWVANSIAAGGANFYNSPSLVVPLQEVVTDVNVTAIVLIAVPNSDAQKQLRFYAQNYSDHSYGSKLTITWTEPAKGRSQGHVDG